MLEQNKLKILHNIEYEAYQELADFCNNKNIKIFLRGGSVLGAVKYHGFVPWDDDIDVALPRKDYIKLINTIPINFSKKFKFISYQKVRNAHCYFPRIVLKEKYRKELGLPSNNKWGLVLIDVLPLDGMPASGIKLKVHIFKAYFYRILASLWTLGVEETVSMHSSKEQAILKFLHTINIHKLYKQDDIYRYLDKLYSKYVFRETTLAGMLASSKLEKEIVPYEWWGEGYSIKFGESYALIPSNYDSYLKQLFGNDYYKHEPAYNKRTKSHFTGLE